MRHDTDLDKWESKYHKADTPLLPQPNKNRMGIADRMRR